MSGGALIVNPNAQIKVLRDAGAITAIEVRAPVKGDRLRTTSIASAAEPALFGTLLVQSATGAIADQRLSADERARLAEIGLLIPRDRVSGSVWFTCDVEDPPYELVPPRLRWTTVPAEGCRDLTVASTLRHFGPAGPPREMRGRLTLSNRFDPDRSWIAVEDAGTALPCFYSYSESTQPPIAQLQPGQSAPAALTPDLRQHLVDAGVLRSPAGEAAERTTRREQSIRARQSLRERRYAVFTDIVPPLQVAAVRRYYRSLIAEGHLPYGDADWPDRFFSSRDPICHFFHQQLTDLVTAMTGQPVKPSFNFFAAYHRGSVLPPHRDREQCEWSMSVLIDHSPEPAHTSPWPLYLQPPASADAIPISVGIGDAILYYGREVRHHREPLTEANYCTYWFFFYVPEDFDGPLD